MKDSLQHDDIPVVTYVFVILEQKLTELKRDGLQDKNIMEF